MGKLPSNSSKLSRRKRQNDDELKNEEQKGKEEFEEGWRKPQKSLEREQSRNITRFVGYNHFSIDVTYVIN